MMLLEATNIMTNKNRAAVALGRLGGRVKSEAKAVAARRNGRRGGRPRTADRERRVAANG